MPKKTLHPKTEPFQDLSMREILSQILNLVALVERKLYLENHPEDKGNGFFKRKLSTGSLTFDIAVPRTRSGTFRPFFLPEKWQRHTKEDFVALVYSLLLSSRSVEAAKRGLKEMDLPVSEAYIDEIVSQIKEYFDVMNTSSLDPDLFALILDAKVVKVKVERSVSSYTVYSSVGISLEGKKQILGILVTDGNESLNGWRSYLKNLLDRGLRRVLIVVHDDFQGLSNLVTSLFPKADDQICTVHMLRNLKYRLPPKAYKAFKEYFQTIKNAYSYDLGSLLFDEACEFVAEYDKNTAKRLQDKKESYLAFLKYPIEVRSSISSTNAAEAFNRRIEDAEQLSGGYFHSVEDLKLKLGIVLKELHSNRWKKPYAKIASVSHILKAEFIKRFEIDCNEIQTQFS